MVLVQRRSFATDVLTYAYDNFRSGANAAEVLLTPRNVNIATFGKVFEYRVDGAVIAQPLIVTDVLVRNARRNVLIVATISNWVYAFDADMRGSTAVAGDALWSRRLGEPAAAWGIMSTPVIDKKSNTIYAVAHVYRNPQPAFLLYALDLRTGEDTRDSGGPIEIEGAVMLESGKSIPFEASWIDPAREARRVNVGLPKHGPYDLQVQRPGLALANGHVIVAFGTPGRPTNIL